MVEIFQAASARQHFYGWKSSTGNFKLPLEKNTDQADSMKTERREREGGREGEREGGTERGYLGLLFGEQL